MPAWEYAIPGWNVYAAGRDIYRKASDALKVPGAPAGSAELQTALTQAAGGRVPSAAEEQLKLAGSRAGAQQYGLGVAMQGSNPGAALRQASIGAANAQGQIAGQTAALRAEEQATARAQLAAWLNAQRDAALTARGQNMKLVGSGLDFGATLGAGALKSDRNAKTDIAPAGDDIERLLDALHEYEFRYKRPGPGAAPGQHMGVMAQDVERGGGGEMVRETPGGKMLDTTEAIGPILASLANLHGRLRGVEGR